jgi:myo-inositol-1(or 4)-monophosphatase
VNIAAKRGDHAAARDILIDAAVAAGDIAMRYFRSGALTIARVDSKHGGSPVTEADLAADAFLLTRLASAFPDAAFLTEEREDNLKRLVHSRLLVIDPIDGTRAFVAGDPRWAVSIALVEAGRPIAGVVHAPALGLTFAAALGSGAALNGGTIAASSRTVLAGGRAAGPRPMLEAIGAETGAPFILEPKVPSLAYRMCLVANGAVDIGLASQKSHDWDIAAADLILEEAGANLVGLDGVRLTYNRRETRHGVLLAAPMSLLGALVAASNRALTPHRDTARASH